MAKTPYTYLEVEFIEKEYDEQSRMKVIADNANREFHKGELVRNENSIMYVVNKLNKDDGWKETLENAWLNQIGGNP